MRHLLFLCIFNLHFSNLWFILSSSSSYCYNYIFYKSFIYSFLVNSFSCASFFFASFPFFNLESCFSHSSSFLYISSTIFIFFISNSYYFKASFCFLVFSSLYFFNSYPNKLPITSPSLISSIISSGLFILGEVCVFLKY